MRIVVSLLLLAVPIAFGQDRWSAPEEIAWRSATIHSEGTRLAAEVFTLRSNADKKLPCILMAHGWGGTVRGLRRDAVAFAQAGYLVVAFDYRGWGNSDPRVVLAAPGPRGKPSKFQAEVIAIREVIDPVEQGRDWLERSPLVAGRTGLRLRAHRNLGQQLLRRARALRRRPRQARQGGVQPSRRNGLAVRSAKCRRDETHSG